ncbi:MAG: NAD(P)-binding protein [Bdellovibrionales bacterium]
MARKKYDYIILGSDICALIIANSLQQSNKKVLIIEPGNQIGDRIRPVQANFGSLPLSFRDLNPSEQTNLSLGRFLNFIGLESGYTKITRSFKTFESGKFKDFLGFGKTPPAFMDLLDDMLSTERIELDEEPKIWFEKLTENLNCDIELGSQVTDFIIEEKNIQLVEVNDSRFFEGNEIINCLPIEEILELKTADLVSKKNRQKIAKTQRWSTLQLSLVHKANDAPDSSEFQYVLRGGTDKSVPCFGFFSEPTNFEGLEDVYQVSHWISYLESELTDDMESSGTLAREMKRQIKRAFPELMNSTVFEKIQLSPNTMGRTELHLQAFREKHLTNFSNLCPIGDFDHQTSSRIHNSIQWLEENNLDLIAIKPDQELETDLEELEDSPLDQETVQPLF